MLKRHLIIVGGLLGSSLLAGCGIPSSNAVSSRHSLGPPHLQTRTRSKISQAPSLWSKETSSFATPSSSSLSLSGSPSRSNALPTSSQISSFPTQIVSNDVYHFHFSIPKNWVVHSQSARNARTYGPANNYEISVSEYGFPFQGGYKTFIAQETHFNIPVRSQLSYLAKGITGPWDWLAESWRVQGMIYYELIYLNGKIAEFMRFRYPSALVSNYHPIIHTAVKTFVP